MKYFFPAILVLSSCSVFTGRQTENSLFITSDHTEENLFSRNIEGPAVDKEGKLFVVNFRKDGTIGLVNDDGTVELFAELPQGSTGNSIQFLSNGIMVIADFTGHNILELNPVTKEISVYVHDERFNQPNDLCVSKKDVIYASDPDWKNSRGQIWKVGNDKNPVLLKTDMGTTNGICLSPDEKILYVNESAQRKVWAFDLNDKGEIEGERLFTSFEDFGLDGMKCDKEGNLYITRYGKGTVAIYSPQGNLIREVHLKGKNVSNLTFGGKKNKTAFVTLQDRKGIEKFQVEIPGK